LDDTASGPDVVGIVSTTGWASKLTTADLQQIQSWENQDTFLWNTAVLQTTYTYDAHGNVATETTLGTDGNTYYADFNLQHVNPWQYAVFTYDSQGALPFTTIKQNDSTELVTTYDRHDVYGWQNAVSGYNAAGQITARRRPRVRRIRTRFRSTLFDKTPRTAPTVRSRISKVLWSAEASPSSGTRTARLR
jgi:hypothetical protein